MNSLNSLLNYFNLKIFRCSAETFVSSITSLLFYVIYTCIYIYNTIQFELVLEALSHVEYSN